MGGPAPRTVSLGHEEDHWTGRFVAMACPCEVLIEDVPERDDARTIADAVAACAWRIEATFSRYLPGNIVHRINNSGGRPISVDEETANLLDFAATLTHLSEGRFDITSGVLRRVWTFDGGDRVPTQGQIDEVLGMVGWDKVIWRRPELQLQPGMQIDFGGIGKEYAVDAAVRRAHELAAGVSCLVNFGGDVAVHTPRRDAKAWRVGIESCAAPGTPAKVVPLHRGGLATSGDSRRYVLKNGRRYSHVLDARTGWPVPDAPHSVSVLAATCTQAGSFSTLALLRGSGAEGFLKSEDVQYWLQ